MQIVGKIDLNKFKSVSDKIITDEVIITDKQVEHIKTRHPGDYERYFSHIPQILSDPDYILKAHKLNSAVLLKEFIEDENRFRLILRLKTTDDPHEYKNSIITFWKISEDRYENYVKNQKILYKKG